MKVLCAWCGKELEDVETPLGVAMTSHGICAECFAKFPPYAKQQQVKEELQAVVKSLETDDQATTPSGVSGGQGRDGYSVEFCAIVGGIAFVAAVIIVAIFTIFG